MIPIETNFEIQTKTLLQEVYHIITTFQQTKQNKKTMLIIPEGFKKSFLSLVDKVNLSLMNDKDNFYGYFLFQMTRELSFDLASPTAVNFKGASYVIYFNPLLFLNLSLKQMETTIKHEILHIVSLHLIRAKEMKGTHSTLAINMAMDIVVNKYLEYLPPYATTLEWVNLHYDLNLEAYQPFEYYVNQLQIALNLLEEEKSAPIDDTQNEDTQKENTDSDNSTFKSDYTTNGKTNRNNSLGNHKHNISDNDIIKNTLETEYSAAKTHDFWEVSSDMDDKTLQEFTEKAILLSQKGSIPSYLQNMISTLYDKKEELPWNLYLKRLMGTVESSRKKTITRRNRRQPDRLDLRGELRSHKAKIVVAFDISGSIAEDEFKQALKEVLSIVKNYSHEITILECDDQIRRVYKAKSVNDLNYRINTKGSTNFNPVFEYANQKEVNLLVYFTDGKGEEKLHTIPRGYPVLWVLSGKGEELSLKEPYGAVKKLSHMKVKEDILDATDVTWGGYSMNYQEKML